jgi:transposase
MARRSRTTPSGSGCAVTARRTKKDLRAEEQGRADVARRRRSWQRWLGWLDPARLVFVDETWIKTNMAPLRGWGPKGARVRGCVPHGHWRTQTFVAALRQGELTAPCVFDGPIDGVAFLAWVPRFLVPTLKPGDVVVLDNLGSHKGAAVRRAVEATGAKLWFLPPYSPDLNPIEQAFSKVKHWLRQEPARTAEDLLAKLGEINNRFPPDECANCLSNVGYGSMRT